MILASIIVRGSRKIGRIVKRRIKEIHSPLKVAIIGCGGISSTHIVGYESLFRSRVDAGSDISAAMLASTLDQWPFLRAYRGYRQMLREIRPDIVSVCTWPQSHTEIVCEAARAGVRGILCEKPIALNLAEIEEMLDVCRDHGVKLGCGHQYRFHPVFMNAAQRIAANDLGKIHEVRGVIRGSVANNGPHLIDTARFLLADPAAVRVDSRFHREKDIIERGLPCEEKAVTTIEFAGGIHAEFETGHPDPRLFRIEVHGDRGSMIVTPTSIESDGIQETFDGEHVLDVCRRRQFGEFVDWVRNARSTYASDVQTASATAELVLAAYESMRVGGSVALPLGNRGDVIRQAFPDSKASGGEMPISEDKPEKQNMDSPTSERLALDGGPRSLKRWFSCDPHLGIAELKNLASVIRSKNLNRVGGIAVPQLESEFAELYGSPCAVASTSGTSAIHVALAALNPEPCDEVITTPLSDMGTVIPIIACNCIPVFADVDPNTGILTAESIEKKITPRTKAVILVHLFGRPADLSPIVELLDRHGIALIEDCAQAHVAEYAGKKVGTFGVFGCFSLQQSKQITCGDGGITLVNRKEYIERAKIYPDKGWARSSGRNHQFFGMNYRMTELQGAVALAQMRKLPSLIAARREPAEKLAELLSRIHGVLLPPQSSEINSSWWKFPIGIDARSTGISTDEFADALRVEGLRMMRRYLPRPLFEEEMIRCRRTFGQSGYPFSAVVYAAPDVSDFPGLAEFNERWLLLEWSSRVKRNHVDGIHRAVEKVIGRLARTPREDNRHESKFHLATSDKELVSTASTTHP
jgi:dTDP-4-amino-4,6-dideoxygalactose transaminase/predicted dehydrogenase